MSTSESLAQRVASAHREVMKLHRQSRRGVWTTAIVGALLLGLLSVYFAYGYSEISDLLKPDTLVPYVADALDNQIRSGTAALEAEVNRSAPTWAEQVSEQIVLNLPKLREPAEKWALGLTDQFVSKHTVMAEGEFRKLIKEHRGTIKDTLDQLAAKQDVSKELLVPLQAAIESELKVEMETQAKDLLEALIEMDAKLQRLQRGASLSREGQAERRILMIVRHLQNGLAMQEIGPGRPRPVAPQATTIPVKAAPASAGKSSPPKQSAPKKP
jgi:hypothetical protein